MFLFVIKEENQEFSHQEHMYEVAYGKVRFDQQSYENIVPIFHAQWEPVYDSHTSEGEENIEQLAKVIMFGYPCTSFFYDSVSFYMESCFSEDFSLVTFGIKSDDVYKYVLQIKFMLHIMSASLSSICTQKDFVIGSMLSWFHWKDDVT